MGKMKAIIRVTSEFDLQLEMLTILTGISEGRQLPMYVYFMLILTKQYIHISKCNKCIVNKIGLIRHIRHYEIIEWQIGISKGKLTLHIAKWGICYTGGEGKV